MPCTDLYLAIMGKSPERIPHWEHLSNPDFVQYVTGIDPWRKPRSAMLRFRELVDIDFGVYVPPDDTPIDKPDDGSSTTVGEDGRQRVRWGLETTNHWEWGKQFRDIADVLAYRPLEHLDLREAEIIEQRDYSLDDESFYEKYYRVPERPDPPVRDAEVWGFYNTMFMWPLLTFGWELFLELAGGYPEETQRIMSEFADISRKVFKSIARAPGNAVVCHDDICMAAGPVCSPAWLAKYVYPYYEEFFGILKSSGKRVIFLSDGNIDKVADDVAACGADGFMSEPFTDWKAIARKYPGHFIAGEGDNRILMKGDPEAVRAMVDGMVDTARICGGYVMCVGNHIPWNIPPENVKLYFDYSREKARRG